MTYLVRRAFTYQGQPYAIGALWEPQGVKMDDAIIRARLVLPVVDEEAPAAPPARHQRGRRVPPPEAKP